MAERRVEPPPGPYLYEFFVLVASYDLSPQSTFGQLKRTTCDANARTHTQLMQRVGGTTIIKFHAAIK